MQPRSDGRAALHSLRPEHDAVARACACIRTPTATSSITSTFPAGTRGSTVTAEAFVECDRRCRCRRSRAGRVGAAGRRDGVRRVLGRARTRARSRSRTACSTQLAHEIGLERGDDPIAHAPADHGASCSRASSTRRRARASTRRLTTRSQSRQGVCQDFAHIMIALVRQLGIPCRYVSGYLFQPGETGRPVARRRHARVGRGLAAGARLGRLRSDAQRAGGRPPHPRRRRPRLRGRTADARRLQGVERSAQRAGRRRQRRHDARYTSDPTKFTPWMSTRRGRAPRRRRIPGSSKSSSCSSRQ